MKYVITENQRDKIYDKIYSHIDNHMSSKNLKTLYYYAGFVGSESKYDSIEVVDMYDEEGLFRIYFPDYWDFPKDDQKTMVILENDLEELFKKMFGDFWKEPFLSWIKNEFPEVSNNEIML